MSLDEAIKRFESIKLYKNFEEFTEDCVYSRLKEGSKICVNDVNSLLFRGYGICDENHCPKYKKYVEYAEENHQLAEWLKELKQLKEQTWSLDDAREDFMYDVYKTLESLPTNDEANRIIEVFDRVTSGIRQEPILDKIRDEIEQNILEEMVVDCSGGEYERTVSTIDLDVVLEIIDKYRAESEG